jgi:hypothetical protein
MLFEAQIILAVLSSILAVALSYLFFKTYRLQHSAFLLGLPVGFLFLAISSIFTCLFLVYGSLAISSTFFWIRLLTRTIGFAFIVFSYAFSNSTIGMTRNAFVGILLASIASVLLVLVAIFLTPPNLELPSVYVVDEYFRITNMFFLGYIIYFLIHKLETATGEVSKLVSAPIAFAILWISQFSTFIWGVDGSLTAFVAGQAMQVIAYAMFLRIYLLTSKRQVQDG